MGKKILLYIESNNAVYYDSKDGNYYYRIIDKNRAKYGAIGGIILTAGLREIDFWTWKWDSQFASFLVCQLALLAGYCVDLRRNKTAFHRMYIGKNHILINMAKIRKANERNIIASVVWFALMIGFLSAWTISQDVVWMLFGVVAEFLFFAPILLDRIFLVKKTLDEIFTKKD